MTTPTLAVFKPRTGNRGAILIAPGGGYAWVVVDKEGYETAAHYAAFGYTVYVLKYRLPHQGWSEGSKAPLADVQRAVRVIRSRASIDNIDPNAILALGFSAGGHVVGGLASYFDDVTKGPTDGVDALSARPNLVALMYPVVTMAEPFRHPRSRENLIGPHPSQEAIRTMSLEQIVRADQPPTFLLHAGDDPAVPVENSILLYQSLRRAGVPATLHVFERGGHGFGMRGIEATPLQNWPDMVISWAASHGFPAPAPQP